MSQIESSLSDIESALSMLKPAEIYALMKGIKINRRVHSIDYSHKARRIERNDMYFSAEPKPHQLIEDRPMSPEEYNGHRDGIWEAIQMEYMNE